MIIIRIPWSRNNSMDVILPHDDMEVDPRVMIGGSAGEWYKCIFSVNGRTLTVTKIDGGKRGWGRAFKLRVYLPAEDIPDFASTVHTYYGLDGECAPEDTTEVIFHPSVNIIKANAFFDCKSLVRVTVPDSVTRIGYYAFYGCDSLRYIQLSRNLVYIGEWAFQDCKSLQAVFLPSTVTYIGALAFRYCASLRFFYVPETIAHIGNRVVDGCGRLLTTVKYKINTNGETTNNKKVNEWLKTRHNSFPLYIACYSTSVTPQLIQKRIQADKEQKKRKVKRLLNRFKSLLARWSCCRRNWSDLEAVKSDDQRMMALHILCTNPFVTGDAIRAYLQLVPDTAILKNITRMTGLHILCSVSYQEASTGDAIRTYLQLAPEAADQEDSEGMTPFQYLSRNDITFLEEDRSFSSLMAWWYGCMP